MFEITDEGRRSFLQRALAAIAATPALPPFDLGSRHVEVRLPHGTWAQRLTSLVEPLRERIRDDVYVQVGREVKAALPVGLPTPPPLTATDDVDGVYSVAADIRGIREVVPYSTQAGIFDDADYL